MPNVFQVQFLTLFVALVSFGACCTRAAEPYQLAPVEVESIPKYADLGDWVALVRQPGFSLIKATRQNGFYIAIFKTKEYEIAFCEVAIGKSPVSRSFEVTESTGKSLLNAKMHVISRDYRVRGKNGVATVCVLDGSVHPLPRSVPASIRVRFCTSKADNDPSVTEFTNDQVIFDEVIQWPDK